MKALGERIVFEDNHVLVVNKLCSELVQGDKTGDICLLDSLKAFIKERDGKPGNVFLGLVHRLDRPSSGLVVYAKTSKALSRLTSSFRERNATKEYLVITEKQRAGSVGLDPAGRLTDFLLKNGKTNTSRVVQGPPGKEAVLDYQLVEELQTFLVWKVHLQTGRHHQIRVQFAARGYPVRGDLKYGARRSIPGGGIGLHAWKLCLPHPTQDTQLILEANPRESQQDDLWSKISLFEH